MATIYCYDGGSNTSPYDTWAKAATTFEVAETLATSSDVVYLASDHVESGGANVTYTTAGLVVYSVDRSDDSYLAASAAQLTTTAGYDITIGAYQAWFGVYFDIGDDLAGTATGTLFEDCTVEMEGSTDKPFASNMLYKNCALIFNGGYFSGNGCRFEGCTFSGTTTNTGYFDGSTMSFVSCDFSGLSTSNSLIDITPSTSWSPTSGLIHVGGCKLPSTFTQSIPTSLLTRYSYIEYVGCDQDGASYSKSYRSEVYAYGGTMTSDTSTYRDSGWSDADGDTNLSHKITPSANCVALAPARGIPLMAYVSSTGSTTFTVHLVENFTTALKDDECWMEISYLGTSDSTLWTVEDTRPTLLASGSTLTTSTEDWTGASGYTKAKLASTVTVNQAGLYKIRVYVGAYESAKVVCYCPKVEIS